MMKDTVREVMKEALNKPLATVVILEAVAGVLSVIVNAVKKES